MPAPRRALVVIDAQIEDADGPLAVAHPPYAGSRARILDAINAAVAAGIPAVARRGRAVEDAGPWSLGRLSAVTRTPDGLLRAAANPRGAQGYAIARGGSSLRAGALER